MKLKICRGQHCYYEALPGHDASCTLTTMDLTVEMSDEWANLGEEDWTTLKDQKQQLMARYKCVGWLVNELPGEYSTEKGGAKLSDCLRTNSV